MNGRNQTEDDTDPGIHLALIEPIPAAEFDKF